MKKEFFILGMLLSLGMIFNACSNDEDVTDSLYNQWVLVSYVNETGEVLKEAKGYYYLITFHPDGTYSGEAYKNELGGEYTCKDNKIKISHPYITKVYWEDSDPDEFYLEHLSDVNTYVVTDKELRLYYSNDHYFKFRINKNNYEEVNCYSYCFSFCLSAICISSNYHKRTPYQRSKRIRCTYKREYKRNS